MKLTIVHDLDEATKLERDDDRPAVGSWWWVKLGPKSSDYADRDRVYLGCVTELGSNYAKVQGVSVGHRLALDDFYDVCDPAPDHGVFIATKLAYHKNNVRELMGEIQQLCHQLGVPFRQALAEAENTTTALASAHSIDNINAYSKSLTKAKDKTLPDLFKRVKLEHERMATWMKADLIPLHAELNSTEGVTKVIEQKIHTVELYAGLQEDLVQVRKGAPAELATKVHLMQRRHYMDEECLAKYEAGGMDFQDVKAFDRWLGRDDNMFRLLPHERCIVAFRIRRHDHEYGGAVDTLANHIKFFYWNKANQKTVLYIRNGYQLWRMATSIDFDEELFPDRESHDLLGDHELWIKGDSEHHIDHGGLITGRRRTAMIQEEREARSELARELSAWKKAGKPAKRWLYESDPQRWTHKEEGEPDVVYNRHNGRPTEFDSRFRSHGDIGDYKLLTPDNLYFDDAMKRVGRAAYEHNRIAVIVQGLLDRSTCLHPHPPWKIWTSEGFESGIELVYDVSKAITPGDAPNFQTYRAQLNKSIREGAHTIGQHAAWRREMERRFGKDWDSYANHGDGPNRIDAVAKMYRDGSCEFEFSRTRSKAIWVPSDRPGYVKRSWPAIPMKWKCPPEHLFCVSAYTPGDFHMFFDDPRMRADYLKWAPFLLAAEDWHHAQREANNPPGKRKRKRKKPSEWMPGDAESHDDLKPSLGDDDDD